MRTTSLTPGRARRLSVSNCSTSPTSPTIVRCTPRLTNADPPAPSTVRTTASSSSAVASGPITTTMTPSFSRAPKAIATCWTSMAAMWRLLDLEALDRGVGAPARAELDEVHRRQHHRRTRNRARTELVTADGDTEDAGEDRLHRHDDSGAGRREMRLRPGLHEECERRGRKSREQDREPDPTIGRWRQAVGGRGQRRAERERRELQDGKSVRVLRLRPLAEADDVQREHQRAHQRDRLTAAEGEAGEGPQGESDGRERDSRPSLEAPPPAQQQPRAQRREHDEQPGDEAADRRRRPLQTEGLRDVAGTEREAQHDSVPARHRRQASYGARPHRRHHESGENEPPGEEVHDRHPFDRVLDDDEGRAPDGSHDDEAERRDRRRRPQHEPAHRSRSAFSVVRSRTWASTSPGVSTTTGTLRVAGCRNSSANGSTPIRPLPMLVCRSRPEPSGSFASLAWIRPGRPRPTARTSALSVERTPPGLARS